MSVFTHPVCVFSWDGKCRLSLSLVANRRVRVYGVPVADRFNLRDNYGNVEGTRHDRILLTSIYQLPVGRAPVPEQQPYGRHVARRLGLDKHHAAGTGPWLTPSISGSFDESNTNVVNSGATLRPDAASEAYRAGSGMDSTSTLQRLLPLLLVPAALAMQVWAFSRDRERSRSHSGSRNTSRSRTCEVTFRVYLHQRPEPHKLHAARNTG
jgi:hypothetical protein